MSAAADATVIIEPPSGWGDLRLREVWEHRELLYFLVKREIQVRYKQSLIGFGWAVIQPLALMVIFWIFFGRLAGVPSEDVPYPVFALAALVPWTFASQGVAQSASSLVADQGLLSKVYFPRLVIPMAKLLSLMLDLAIAFGVFLFFALLYGVTPRLTVVWIPALLVLAAITAFGIGTLLAAINVKYRDVALMVPLLVQVWLFATPVVYPGSLVKGVWQYVYALNPMVTVIGGFRWAFFGSSAPSAASLAISIASALLIASLALVYFRRTERFFADVV